MVRQLHPSDHQHLLLRTPSLVAEVGHKIPLIPGLRTSATFLTSLGANLRIPDDDLMPSPMSTPPSMRASLRDELSSSLPPPSPLASAAIPASGPALTASFDDPLSGIPELITKPAADVDDRIAALKLVADSVAQQRQFASRVLIFNPLNISVFVVVLAIVINYLYKSRDDIPLIFTTCAGIAMAALAMVRYFTSGYIQKAESINWKWLDDDRVIITKFGDEVIGALVLGWVAGEGRGSRRKRIGRGLIRAWTVRLKYRGRGVGTGLLEEAVEVVNRKGGDGIDFAQDHANGQRVLARYYNGAFDRKENDAQTTLENVIQARGNFIKKRACLEN